MKVHLAEGALCACGAPATHRVEMRAKLYGVERSDLIDRAACHACAAAAVRRLKNRTWTSRASGPARKE